MILTAAPQRGLREAEALDDRRSTAGPKGAAGRATKWPGGGTGRLTGRLLPVGPAMRAMMGVREALGGAMAALSARARPRAAARSGEGRPLAPSGPRWPLSPPAPASSSARALGAAAAAATSPQVWLCDPAERWPGRGGQGQHRHHRQQPLQPPPQQPGSRPPASPVPAALPPGGAGPAAAVPCPARPATMWSTRCGA